MQNPSSASAVASDFIPPAHMAIIAAIVSTVAGRRSRVHSVKQVQDKSDTHRPWAAEGRRDIFSSHRLR